MEEMSQALLERLAVAAVEAVERRVDMLPIWLVSCVNPPQPFV